MKKISEFIGNNKKIIIPVFLLLVVLIGGSYAWLRLSITGGKTNRIVAGSLQLSLDDEAATGVNLEKAIPMSDADGLATTAYTFTLKNNGTASSDYTVYLDDEALTDSQTRMLDKYVKYSLVKNDVTTTNLLTTTGRNPNRVLDVGTIAGGETNTYSLKVWINKDADNAVMNTVFKAKIRVEAMQESSLSKYQYTNKNIKAVYTYDDVNTETRCITGEEATCQQISLTSSDTASQGTIIKYAVNDSEEKYFYVLHDDGETMTLQQRENTIDSVYWSADGYNSSGPITVISELETITNSWTNVNNQIYTMGKTIFKNNSDTACFINGNFSTSQIECSYNTNSYVWAEKTSKVRLITAQEMSDLGCSAAENSCPIWAMNYLRDSLKYGGTVSASESNFYWAMTTQYYDNKYAFTIRSDGKTGLSYVKYSPTAARAVIVINK